MSLKNLVINPFVTVMLLIVSIVYWSRFFSYYEHRHLFLAIIFSLGTIGILAQQKWGQGSK